MHVDAYLEQHKELLEVVTQISARLTPQEIAADAKSITSLLSTFSLKLFFHLSMEDKALYPAMLNSKDAATSQTAKKFMDEMGKISQIFTEYKAKWSNSVAIQADPTGFISETNNLFAALGDRVTREENELYVLAAKA